MFFRSLFLGAALAGVLRAEPPLAAAARLYAAQDYAGASAVLAPILAREPDDAPACHLYGMCLRQRGDARALDDAHPWLERASNLEPANPEYLADLAGNCLQLAQLHWSFRLAVRGRDLMETALRRDPTDVGGREGLMRFYREAPWPLGDRARAEALAAEIARLDPRRGALAAIYLQRQARNYPAALALALAALPSYPDDYRILFEVGRGAALAGRGAAVPAGIAALQKCQRLTPPMDAPSAADVADQLGILWARQGNLGAARAAYATALKRNPGDETARRALEQLP
jgi:tetratricopeptide (TPR) repeat protein